MNRTLEFNVTALNEDGMEDSTTVAVEVTDEEWQRMLASEPSCSLINDDPTLEELTLRVQKAAYSSDWTPFPDEDDDGFFALDFPSYIVDYPHEAALANWKARAAQKQ